MEQWKQTSWAKRLETRQKRAQMTDFERFKLKMAKRVVSFRSFTSSFSSVSSTSHYNICSFVPSCCFRTLSQMNTAVHMKLAAIKKADRKQRMAKKAQKK